jgi:hypothetical protein
MLLVEINQMLSSVALSSCVIVTTTPLTSLRVFMSIIFLESVLVVVRTLALLKILFFPFPHEIPFEFLATKLFINILSIEMYPQGAFDDSLLRACHAFLLGVNHILSQNI